MQALRKFLNLSTSDRLLLIYSLLLLTVIRLGLWLLPFQTLWRLISKIAPAITDSPEAELASIKKVSWAIVTVSRYQPGIKCLARALATKILLNWRGQSSRLCIGVAKAESGKLEAHAWVESCGTIVIGGIPDLSRYTLLPPLLGEGA